MRVRKLGKQMLSAQGAGLWVRNLLAHLQVVILMLEDARLPAIEGQHQGLPLYILRPHFHLLRSLRGASNRSQIALQLTRNTVQPCSLFHVLDGCPC